MISVNSFFLNFKKMKKSIAIITLIWLLGTGSTNLFSQSVDFSKYNFPNNRSELSEALGFIKAGDRLYSQGPGVYHLAIEEYKKAHKFNPRNALLNYKLGRCYLVENDKSEAIGYLKKAIALDPRISLDLSYNDVNFLLATAYHLDYKFDEAIEKYKAHKASLSPEQLLKDGQDIDKRIDECVTAKKLVAKPVRAFVDNLGNTVNSAFPDYRPLVVPDEEILLFTSARDNTTGGNRASDSYFYEDVYVSYYENGKWSAPQNSFDLNSNNHDATAGISSDGSILYVYKAGGGNHLYESNLSGDKYTVPVKMDSKINAGLKQSSASLSFDRSTLYFTSVRSDGYGGSDIYMTKKDARGRWQDPVNLGATINTPYDEEGVFIDPDNNTLFFSSRGHNSMGGYDIFKSEFVEGRWTAPVNLGYPINTPDDDVFFTLGMNGQRGYYSSKKGDGYGGHDLYLITFLGASKPLVLHSGSVVLAHNHPAFAPQPASPIEQNTVLEGVILDDFTLTPLQATIEITDNIKNELLASFESSGESGTYLISLKPGKNYGITVSRPDYLFYSENFNIPENAEATKIKKDILLNKLEVGSKVVLNNIFFDFNKATLRNESIAELERVYKLLTETPTLKIEISGHTDNVGSASYNQKLSENRAKAVVDFLLERGIGSARLQFMGYGMTQPVVSNDTEQDRQQNRRTEFKVIEK
jgi:outer membrane protein OmpA-like peptidoglycan-associated protein/tetratricopeptide (TPR) repeat protein